jgi:hypothetical protein
MFQGLLHAYDFLVLVLTIMRIVVLSVLAMSTPIAPAFCAASVLRLNEQPPLRVST